jgi:glycosyltransferase involved in cell wall biosynthesis
MTIIVPVYNEVESLDRLSEVLKDYLSQAAVKSKVLFVDDGSTDGSREKIRAICKDPDFSYIRFKENRGLSSAIKAGIDHCDTPLLAYIDADLQTTPYDFDLLLEDIKNYDAVIGYRAKRKDTLSKKIQSRIANAIRRSLIDDGIIDTGCPLKVIKTEMAKRLPFFDGMHRFIPALIRLEAGEVKQKEVQHFEREAGQSKFNIFNRSIRPLQDAFAYRWMKSRYINYEIAEHNLKEGQ